MGHVCPKVASHKAVPHSIVLRREGGTRRVHGAVSATLLGLSRGSVADEQTVSEVIRLNGDS